MHYSGRKDPGGSGAKHRSPYHESSQINFRNNDGYYHYQAASDMTGGRIPHSRYDSDDLLSDEEERNRAGNIRGTFSNDEFGDGKGNRNSLVRTGRQRKKLAARSKGGEFRTVQKKRRVYFCCLSSEIDVQRMLDYLVNDDQSLRKWKFELYSEVLRLYKDNAPQKYSPSKYSRSRYGVSSSVQHQVETFHPLYGNNSSISNNGHGDTMPEVPPYHDGEYYDGRRGGDGGREVGGTGASADFHHDGELARQDSLEDVGGAGRADADFDISNGGAQEVFIFDFGAVVFWGFGRGEEAYLLRVIRRFATKGMIGAEEFSLGEDDMGFTVSPAVDAITLANDVIDLPEGSRAKQRMSLSFAIAQSSVLSVFESRIERKVEEYKYIPEALAAHGKVHLTEQQLGMMIGEVFVIRHDVNLHTEILDTPDFFWREENYELDYRMVMSYLEMSGRTEILNKRLDMLRELLTVLQQQMENAHATKLEWIVIWLIVAEVGLQLMAILIK